MPMGERPEPIFVGHASEARKQEAMSEVMNNFRESNLDDLLPENLNIIKKLLYEKFGEKEKEEYQLRTIELVNQATNELLEEFGLKPFDIPEKNIHIVRESLYKQIDPAPGAAGCTIGPSQTIVINDESLPSPLSMSGAIAHEMIHLKGYYAFEVSKKRFASHRTGLVIDTTYKKSKESGYYRAFKGLNESVVSELEKRLFNRIVVDNEHLSSESERINSQQFYAVRARIAKQEGIPEDEILDISEKEKSFTRFDYYSQRRVLNFIVDAVYENNKESFQSRDEILKQFFRAHFQGNIVPIARLIEKTFGEGSFRFISVMGDNEGKTSSMVMDYLVKQKARIVKTE